LSNLNFFCERLEDFSPGQGTFLFNRKEHLLLQSNVDWFCYGIEQSNRVKAIIFFNVSDSVAQSPVRAPFGSFEFFDEVSDSEFDEWLSFILNKFQEKGYRSIFIKNYPAAYDLLQSKKIKSALLRRKFILSQESTSIIKIDTIPFIKKIALSKKQKLTKCLNRFIFIHNPQTDFNTIYSFIEQCRHKKEYQLSMTKQEIAIAVSTFPSEFVFFTVVEESALVAAAICIKVSPQILYIFYYDHSKLYDKLSPNTMLLNGIYSYGLDNGFLLIDLGTSHLDGILNKSLQHFKASVGGKPSDKYMFHKSI
jgi:hypothetical protein